MAEAAALQTEITIVDKASAAFDAIDKAAKLATASLDVFLDRVEKVNRTLEQTQSHQSVSFATPSFSVPEFPKNQTPTIPAPSFKPLQPVAIPVVPKLNLDQANHELSTVATVVRDAGQQCEDAFDGIGLSIGQNLGRVSQLKGGILDFASKLGPAMFAAEQAINLVGKAADKAIEAISRGDDIAKTSRALHINAQAFQELDYAIQRGGGSSQDFSTGIRVLNKQISLLKKGSSTAKEAFGRLGLDLEKVDSLGLEGTLYAVSDALHSMTDVEDVDDVMQTLFGRGGFKLASAFSVGSEKLDELRKQARATGAILQDDALAMSEKGADRMLDATLSLQSVWQNISNAIMPTVVDSLDKVSQFFKDHQESIGKIEKLVSHTIGMILDGVFAIAGKLSGFVALVGDIASFFDGVIDIVEQGLGDLSFAISGPNEQQQDSALKIMNQMAEIGGLAYKQRLQMIGEIQAQTFVLDDSLNVAKRLSANMEKWNNRKDTVNEVTAKSEEAFLRNYSDIKFQDWARKQAGVESWTNEEVRQKYNDFINDPKNFAETGLITNAHEQGEAYELVLTLEDMIANRETFGGDAKSQIDALEGQLDRYIQAGLFGAAADADAMIEALKAATFNNQDAISRLNAQLAEANGHLDVYEKRVLEFQNQQSELAKQIAHNTKSVRIDKDSILFMKQMATAEIINKYNTINNSVSTNISANDRPSVKVAKEYNSAMIDKVVGASAS